MGKIQYTPRWLHKTVTIDTAGEFRIPSTNFANRDPWDWQLQWLSVTGIVDTDGTGGTYFYNFTNGGVARRLKWNIGYSQKGDLNLSPIATDAVMGCNFRQRQCYSPFDASLRFDFPIPFPVPPDTGINAEARFNLKASDTILTEPFPGIVLNGYRKLSNGRKQPAQLAGHYDGTLPFSTTMALEDADLWNDGDSDLYLTQLLIQPGQLTAYTDASGYTEFMPHLNGVAWRVNPSTGTPWMPRPESIPAGNIAPYNRAMYDWADESTRVYTFPTETRLKPDQRLGLKLENLSSSDQLLDICLFGLLEVQ
jgi:hypothetical protein